MNVPRRNGNCPPDMNGGARRVRDSLREKNKHNISTLSRQQQQMNKKSLNMTRQQITLDCHEHWKSTSVDPHPNTLYKILGTRKTKRIPRMHSEIHTRNNGELKRADEAATTPDYDNIMIRKINKLPYRSTHDIAAASTEYKRRTQWSKKFTLSRTQKYESTRK